MSYQPSFYKQIFHSSSRFLAKHWLSLQPTLQIAITGSHGKTNTTNVLAKILETIGNTIRTDLNLDTTYNVPITALKIMPWTKCAVFELGIDHSGEMDSHLQIVKPKIGIITGISPVHTDQEHLKSLDTLIKEKRKLIETLPQDGYAILNYDDEHVRTMSSYTKAKIIWYGTDKKNCDVWVDPKSVRVSLNGTSFKLRINKPTRFNTFVKNRTSEVKIKLIGKHHIYTIMAVVATLLVINKLSKNAIDPFQCFKTLKSIQPLPGRMSVEKGPMKTVLLNDSLRANPTSTKSGLETLSKISYNEGRKIAVLGEMGELEKPEEEHRKIGKLIGKLTIDYLVAIGPLQKFVAEEAVKSGMKEQNIFWAKDVYEGSQFLKKILNSGDLVYLKGSLHRHVERALEP